MRIKNKQPKSWTWRCKNFIVALLTFIIVFVLVLVTIEIVNKQNNTAIALALIGLIGMIIPILGTLITMLLKHERLKEKTKNDEEKENTK